MHGQNIWGQQQKDQDSCSQRCRLYTLTSHGITASLAQFLLVHLHDPSEDCRTLIKGGKWRVAEINQGLKTYE